MCDACGFAADREVFDTPHSKLPTCPMCRSIVDEEPDAEEHTDRVANEMCDQ